MPYLSGLEVEATVRIVAARSAPASTLVVNYQTASATATLGRLFARATRRADPLAHEPRRSHWSPDTIGALLGAHGFAVRADVGLLDVVGELGVVPTHPRSMASGRVVVAGT